MSFEAGLIALAGAVLAALSALYVYFKADRKRALLTTLRVSAYVLILFALLRPSLERAISVKRRTAVAVIADVSKSMGLKNPEDKSALLKAAIKEKAVPLTGIFDVSWYAFSGTAQKTSLEDLLKSNKFSGDSTDIAAAVNSSAGELEKERPGAKKALVIISDGNNNGFLDPVEAAKQAGIPVYTIGAGPIKKGVDVAVRSISAGELGFTGMQSTVTVNISGANASGRSVRVVLKADGIEIGSKEAVLKDDGLETAVKFEVTPKETGLVRYRAEAKPLPGEEDRSNNSAECQVRVLKEKVRILYLSGHPNYEYRFLRQVLKTNPNYEMVSFILLRGINNVMAFPEDQLTLIPFPVEELFTKDLPQFDIVVLESFPYSEYMPPQMFDSLARLVTERGGALLMIGGDQSFGRGGYAATPLADLLPVALEGPSELYDTAPYRMVPEPHPLNSLSYSKEGDALLWKSMAELSDINVAASSKPGAAVLGRHPTLKSKSGEFAPVLAAWQKGRGRVMACLTGSTWRWAMGTGQETSSGIYARYWQGLFNWLSGVPDVKQVKIAADKKAYGKNEPIRLSVSVLDEHYRFENAATVALSVSDPNGKKTREVCALSGNGIYECAVSGEVPGKYSFEASVYKQGKELGKDACTAEVAGSLSEESDIYLNETLLSEIAEKSGGEYLNAASGKAFLLKIDPETEETVSKTRKALWDSPVLLLLAVLILCGEWYVRRTSGML